MQTQELYDKVKRRANLDHIQQAASDLVDATLPAAPQYQFQADGGDQDRYGHHRRNDYRIHDRSDLDTTAVTSNAQADFHGPILRRSDVDGCWPTIEPAPQCTSN